MERTRCFFTRNCNDPGKVWHNEHRKHLYFIFIDIDTQKAIDELCTISSNITSLQELSKKFLIEQHKDNPQKAHVYFYSHIPFPKKNADSIIGLEVKGLGEHGIAFCFPSTHKDGMPYEIIGTTQPLTLTIEQARELIQHINQICIKHGLQYLEIPTPLFVKYNQTAQTEPDRNYEPDIFDKFLQLTNVKDEHSKILLKVYIVSLFIPDIPHAILVLHGEKGSAKSTLQQLIKLLVDPAKPILLTIHKDRNEFIQQLNHNYVAFYDNVKHVPYWLSDEACKAATGIGQTKRKLYSDDEDIVYEYKRCLGFNGINISLTEPDALDRSIIIELDRISKENRRQESEIIAEFLKLRPKLLAYIFDILVKALQIKPTIKLADLPRMADFALWGEAISQAMDTKPFDFINAYYENIGRQNIEAIEAHPLGQAIAKFCDEEFSENNNKEAEDQGGENKTEWEDTASEFLERLVSIANKHKIDTQHKLWPKAVNSLIHRLNTIKSNLLEGLAIEVAIRKATTKEDIQKYGRNITVVKVGKTSLTGQNHEGKIDNSVKDHVNVNDHDP